MKRTYQFVQQRGTVICQMPGAREVEMPVVQGIFKHATPEMLFELLKDPQVALKITLEALRIASWPVLRLFPRDYLKACLPAAELREGRLRALEFMLGGPARRGAR